MRHPLIVLCGESVSLGREGGRTGRVCLIDYLLLRLRITAPVVDVHVTRPADHEGLAFPCRHELYPPGLFPSALHVQVAKRTDVMDFDIHRRAAHLAFVR